MAEVHRDNSQLYYISLLPLLMDIVLMLGLPVTTFLAHILLAHLFRRRIFKTYLLHGTVDRTDRSIVRASLNVLRR